MQFPLYHFDRLIYHAIFWFENRNGYCIKEVSSLTADICGKTQYFGDDYTNSQCEFRKCGDTCTAGTLTFEFEGESYTRTRYCCKNDYCNSAVSTKLPYVLVTCLMAAVAWFLAM